MVWTQPYADFVILLTHSSLAIETLNICVGWQIFGLHDISTVWQFEQDSDLDCNIINVMSETAMS